MTEEKYIEYQRSTYGSDDGVDGIRIQADIARQLTILTEQVTKITNPLRVVPDGSVDGNKAVAKRTEWIEERVKILEDERITRIANHEAGKAILKTIDDKK